jgi:hypothetical protein
VEKIKQRSFGIRRISSILGSTSLIFSSKPDQLLAIILRIPPTLAAIIGES